jgi:UDP-2,4-diacetamido-2,4,6-trideoxy-beta-L-altropyranose hydrolase
MRMHASAPLETGPVVLLADAGPEAGLGHLSRASALAVALDCRGVDRLCYAYGTDEPLECDGVHWLPVQRQGLPAVPRGVLVVDSYRLPREELQSAAESSRLVVMHDCGDLPTGVALVVSPAVKRSAVAETCLGGLEHAVLRPGFWGLPRRQLGNRVDQVLVTTGSGKFDSLGHDIALAVASALPEAAVTLVRGPYAKSCCVPQGVHALDAPHSLVEALLFADLVVTAGGQTMLEAAAAGTPCIALPLAENQHRQIARLARVGAVCMVKQPGSEEAAAAAVGLARDDSWRRDLSRRSQQAIDGYGALRVAFHVERLALRF